MTGAKWKAVVTYSAVFWLEIVKNSKLDLYVSVMVEVNTGNQ
jgi:hypothetical protein